MPERALPVPEEDRRRQRDVLTDLRSSVHLKPAEAAAAIGVSVTQLGRYESGSTILPTPYYRAVAYAYGITVAELTRRLGLLDDEAWDFRTAMRGIITEAQIAEQWAEIKDDPIKDQMAHALELQEEAERRRSEAMKPPKASRRRRSSPERTARGA